MCVIATKREQFFSLLKLVFNIVDYPTFLRIKGKRNSLQRAHIFRQFKDSALLEVYMSLLNIVSILRYCVCCLMDELFSND